MQYSIINPDECTDLSIYDTDVNSPTYGEALEVKEHLTKQIPRRALTNPYTSHFQASDSINQEQTCQFQVLLLINEIEQDRKFFSINLVP